MVVFYIPMDDKKLKIIRKIFAAVITLTIIKGITPTFPILNLFVIFLLPFLMMTQTSVYENAISNSSTTAIDA